MGSPARDARGARSHPVRTSAAWLLTLLSDSYKAAFRSKNSLPTVLVMYVRALSLLTQCILLWKLTSLVPKDCLMCKTRGLCRLCVRNSLASRMTKKPAVCTKQETQDVEWGFMWCMRASCSPSTSHAHACEATSTRRVHTDSLDRIVYEPRHRVADPNDVGRVQHARLCTYAQQHRQVCRRFRQSANGCAQQPPGWRLRTLRQLARPPRRP